MTSQPRPVWLTRRQRDWLADSPSTVDAAIVSAWDAAPADAAEAVTAAIYDNDGWESQARAVLVALRMPQPSPRHEVDS